MKKGKIIGGVIVGAIAACAVYFLTSDKTKKQREELVKFANNMKADIIKKMKELSDVTKEDYDKIVNEVSEKYAKVSKVSEKEFKNIVKDIKNGWKHIRKAI